MSKILVLDFVIQNNLQDMKMTQNFTIKNFNRDSFPDKSSKNLINRFKIIRKKQEQIAYKRSIKINHWISSCLPASIKPVFKTYFLLSNSISFSSFLHNSFSTLHRSIVVIPSHPLSFSPPPKFKTPLLVLIFSGPPLNFVPE